MKGSVGLKGSALFENTILGERTVKAARILVNLSKNWSFNKGSKKERKTEGA